MIDINVSQLILILQVRVKITKYVPRCPKTSFGYFEWSKFLKSVITSPVKEKLWNYWDYVRVIFNHRCWCLATTDFSPQFALHLPCRVTFKKHVEQQASLLLSSRLLSYDLSLLFLWDCALITDHLQRWTGPSGKSVTFVTKNPLNMQKNTVGTMELLAVTTAKLSSSIAITEDW